MAANMDDHTKNFAFLLPQNGKFSNITAQDIEAVADRYEMRKLAQPVIAKTRAALERWAQHANNAGVGQQETDSIAQDIAAQCASGLTQT